MARARAVAIAGASALAGGRRWRGVALALLVVACRSAPARGPAATAGAPAKSGGAAPPVTVYVTSAPSVLVASGEQPFLLLDIAMARAQGGELAVRIAYLASKETSDARAEDASRREMSTAALLLEALAPVLPRDVRAADVTAVFGPAGTWGLAAPILFVREAGRWRGAEVGGAHPVLVPPLPRIVARSTASEEAAVDAARRFLDRVDDGDYDGAWKLVSAVVKAAKSRNVFDEELRQASPPGQQRTRRERFRQYEPRSGELSLGDILHLCLESKAGIDLLQVRLDDDQEWRVASMTHLAAAQRRDDPPSRAAAEPRR